MQSHKYLFKTLVLAAALTATQSFAANSSYSGTVNQVEFVNGSAAWFPLLYIRVNNTAPAGVMLAIGQQPSPTECAPPTGPGFPTTSMETLKSWESIARTALLSGKTITVYWTDCPNNANKYIYSVVLNS